MTRKSGKMLRLMAMTLVILMALPVQTIWAASGKVTTKVKHKPPKDEYIPGFRIQLDAKIKDKAGLLATRCYFKAKKDKVFTFVNMNNIEDDEYRAILPAPWVNSEFVEYLFITVNKNKQVTRTQMFKIEEAETKEAAQWQEAGEVKELRIDKVQEVVEEYEELRKEIREKYRKKRAKYQIESQDVMTVLTEVDESLVSLNGFYDAITLSRVPAAASYGVLTEGLYTAEQVAAVGGAAAVSSATGVTSAGTIEAATGMSTAAIVGIGVGAAVVIGGGAAAGIALSNSDDEDDEVEVPINTSAGVRWGDYGSQATHADDAFELWFAGRFIGTSPTGRVGEATVSGLEVGTHELQIRFVTPNAGLGSFAIDLSGGASFSSGGTHREGLLNLNETRTFTANVPAP